MADHKHGEMEISEQRGMFSAFVSVVTRVSVAILVFLLILAMING